MKKKKNHLCSAQKHCKMLDTFTAIYAFIYIIQQCFSFNSWDQQYETELENFKEFGDIGKSL